VLGKSRQTVFQDAKFNISFSDMTTTDIMKFNLPNSIPFIIDFDENMKTIGPIRFLANDDIVAKAIEKVKSIGK
jgi:2,3-bisphosphoglycerate-dependent phosphoglycerate mutase